MLHESAASPARAKTERKAKNRIRVLTVPNMTTPTTGYAADGMPNL
jgi:hypothetical protein